MEDESTLTQTIAGAEDLNTQAVKPERNQQAGKPKDRIYEQSIPVAVVEQAAEEVETLHGSIKAGTIAQIVVAFIAIIGLIYLLKLVLVTTLASILLAYVLEPAVVGLMRLRIPRQIGALITVAPPCFWRSESHTFRTIAPSTSWTNCPDVPLVCATRWEAFVQKRTNWPTRRALSSNL